MHVRKSAPRRSCGALLLVLAMWTSPSNAADTLHGSTPLVAMPPAGLAYASPATQLRARDALPRLEAGTVEWTARIAYTDGEIYNPATGRMDHVRLRSYQGEGVNPAVPFVPPAIILRPGDTFRFTLINDLPAEDPSCIDHGDINIPHCFNDSNMHTHGLWVSPAGNSDNVLLRLAPGQRFTHEYNVPSDHPAGTFWYHPHLHGSTALQVSSGMGGPLIVRGERLPGADRTGDIDTLLRTVDGAPFAERVFVLTQIAYACGPRRADGTIEIKTDEDGYWVCEEGDVGAVEGYNQFGVEHHFDTPTGIPDLKTRWEVSGRHTAVNGQVVPTIYGVRAGVLERWRVIQAGVSGSVSLSVRRYTGAAPDLAYRGGDADSRARFVVENCAGPEVAQFSIALDGLTRSQVMRQGRSNLHPGYRDDLLMVFPESGAYCLIDNEAPRADSIRMQSKQRQLLGFVVVDGECDALDGHSAEAFVGASLRASAARHMPADARDRVVEELSRQPMSLASFVAHRSLLELPVDGEQTLGFDTIIVEDAPQNEFVVGNLELTPGELPRLIEASDYVSGRIDRTLTLDNVEEWTLAAFTEGHPFHKHVNPVQIVSIVDPDTGVDVSAFDSGSVYAGLKGQWKDTIFLPTNIFGVPYTVTVRTHYRRYIGTFVLHCHILDHEDFGMMQALQIVPAAPTASASVGHH